MDLLVLGGTRFVGRHIVDAALAAGHRVTLFHRGKTNPDLFPDAEHVLGDREFDLDLLRGRRWDRVIDTSGYVPRLVRLSARTLADATDHYTFISSLSVYAAFREPGYDEDAPLLELEDPDSEDVDAHYRSLKVACEREVLAAFFERSAIVRAGMVVGPHDHTGRFTYWPRRVAAGGEVLVPGRPTRQVSFIDARDLSQWVLAAADAALSGPFNATGQPVAMSAMLAACLALAKGDVRLTYVRERFLLDHGVEPWSELPLWIPDSDEDMVHMMLAGTSRARDAGLRTRSLEKTVRDTLAWDAGRTEPPPPDVGLDPERERRLLAEWHAR